MQNIFLVTMELEINNRSWKISKELEMFTRTQIKGEIRKSFDHD